MGLFGWLFERGMRDMARRVSRKTGGNLNASWETVFGDLKQSNADELWGELNDKERLEAYKGHALVYACVRRITDAYKEAPIELGTMDADGEWDRVNSHEVLDVIHRPNPNLSWGQFNDYRWAHRLTTGKAVVWKWRDARGRVAELWPLPPNWVEVVPLKDLSQGDGRRFISHYRVRVPGGRRFRIEPSDVIYERFVDPMNFTEGVGPLQACYRDHRLGQEKDNYILEMLTNVSVPGLVLRQDEEFDEDQKRELRALLAEKVGYGRRGSPLFLSGEKAGVEALAPLKDLDWPGLSAMTESHICCAFGVPPLLVHARVAQENSPLSSPNLEAAEKVFYRSTMLGIWDTGSEGLTQGLLRDEGEGDLEFRHNISEVSALQSDMKEMAEIVDRVRDFLEFNEVRGLLGRQPEESMDGVYLRRIGVAEVRAGDTPEPQGDGGDEGEHGKVWGDL